MIDRYTREQVGKTVLNIQVVLSILICGETMKIGNTQDNTPTKFVLPVLAGKEQKIKFDLGVVLLLISRLENPDLVRSEEFLSAPDPVFK